MLIVSFILEYSNVLFDANDNNILFYRPISDKTVFLGRVVYIALFAFLFGLSMGVIPLIYLLIAKGCLVFLSFLVAVITIILFSVFFSLFLYMLLMRWVGGEKLNKFIFIFQMLISIGIILISNVGSDYLKTIDFSGLNFFSHYWCLLIPPAWEVAIVDMFSFGNYSLTNILLSIMAVLVPLVLGVISYKFLSKSFKQEILKFDVKSEGKTDKKRFSFANIFAKLFTRNREELSIFKTIYRILHREKTFMMSMYSSFAFLLVITAINFYKISTKEGEMTVELSNRFSTILLYILSMVFISAAQRFSIGNFKDVSDKYKAAPIARPGIVKIATIKVLNCKFLIPVLTVASVFIIYLWGWDKILSLISVYFIVNIIAAVIIFSGKSRFPLSLSKADGEKTGDAIISFILLILAGFIHYGVLFISYGILVYMLVAGLLYYLLMRRFRKVMWGDFV